MSRIENVKKIFVDERIRHTENYEKHRQLKPSDKQALDYGLGYSAALQFAINHVGEICQLFEARIEALRLEILKEIAEDMKERFKPYAVIHGVSYVPMSFIELYISRLEMGAYKPLKESKEAE